MIVLHDYWRSTASYRVRIALGLAGIEWETRPVNLLEGAHKSSEHLAQNPQGLVPVLEIDGHTLTQSVAQIEYIDETRDLGLLPSGALERARVRALASVITMEVHPVCNLSVTKFAVAQSNGAIEAKQWMQHFISRGLTAFEAMLADGDYCYGRKVSLADVCLVPQVYNATRWGVSLGEMPKIQHIVRVLAENSAFAAAHPDLTPQG
jgi:maleylacetoacetate isomerase